ncbi:MAG: serine/threonine-protein kinase [Myxococcales bacterium]|nr:serine/threonine protein kinase [Myxococcota bacterium]MDW8281043.1 serine/threonine-protein kinase [Myxococcales bacterium]
MQEGEHIDGYRVIRKLGEGAMGQVFEAEHEQGHRAAIKVLHAEYSADPELLRRFLNEARAASMIDHPGVVKILGTGHAPDGSAYFAMEFLEGESLRTRLKKNGGKMGSNMLHVGAQIAAALAAAHEQKIIHRDLKPDNIMLVPDLEAPGGERVKILDFGIAKLLEAEDVGVKTAAGMAMGTPTYMSPEQFTGAAEATDRSDVYSLGVILYHFVAGRPPFVAQGPGELLALHLKSQPVPLEEINPGVHRALSSLIHQMLAKKPMERPTMAEVRDALLALSEGRMPQLSAAHAAVPPPPSPEVSEHLTEHPTDQAETPPASTPQLHAGPPPSRRPLLLWLGLGGAALLGGAGWLALRARAPSRAATAKVDPAPIAPPPPRPQGEVLPPPILQASASKGSKATRTRGKQRKSRRSR